MTHVQTHLDALPSPAEAFADALLNNPPPAIAALMDSLVPGDTVRAAIMEVYQAATAPPTLDGQGGYALRIYEPGLKLLALQYFTCGDHFAWRSADSGPMIVDRFELIYRPPGISNEEALENLRAFRAAARKAGL